MAKYPDSKYKVAVYSLLTTAYMGTNQIDKMVDAGGKVLQIDPDDVDILPILAWAVPRRFNGQTAEGHATTAKSSGLGPRRRYRAAEHSRKTGKSG